MSDKKSERKEDIHITVDQRILKAAKIRCIEDDLVLSEVITDLLSQWVDGRIKFKKGDTIATPKG